MPTSSSAKSLSALTGFGLFLTAIVLCYLNTTTAGFFGSTVFFVAIAVTSLGMAAKWSIALGVENKFAEFADKVASLLPWLAVVVNGYQALHYQDDGLSGFMAGVAVISLVFVGSFGLLDSISSVVGKKFHQIQDAVNETQLRLHAASDALAGAQAQRQDPWR
jgi:hypothetical protein